MNPIFKNALAMTLLLSASVALKASDDLVKLCISPSENGVVVNILPTPEPSMRQTCKMLKHALPEPSTETVQLPVVEQVKRFAQDVNIKLTNKLSAMGEQISDSRPYRFAQWYANKFALACEPAVAKAKAFGEYVMSRPQATEGARLGGYLTLDNAKNVGTKLAVAAAAYYGLKALYNHATSKSETNKKSA